MEKQLVEIEDLKKEKCLKLHSDINYKNCSGLSNEIKEILDKHKPQNIGEATELPGMTPAAAAILLRFAKK